MFVTLNQFYIFLACVMFGALGGVFFSFFGGIKHFIYNKVLDILFDIFCMAILGVAFSVFSFKYAFPNLRVYMLVGVLLGLSMYLKSFHRILAKFTKKVYNITIRKFTKGKERKNDRNKSKKGNSGVNGGGSIATIYSSDNNGLSNDFNRGKKESHRILRKSNRKVRNVN